MVPLLALPLLVPVIIGASQASSRLLDVDPANAPAKWLLVLALYDLVFGLLAYGVFDFLVED
jgi:heme exporter protein B